MDWLEKIIGKGNLPSSHCSPAGKLGLVEEKKLFASLFDFVTSLG